MKRYNVILLDADNTLFDFDMAEKNAISAIFGKYNIPNDFIPIYSGINKSLWEELERGKITRERLKVKRFEIIFSMAKVNLDDGERVAGEYTHLLAEQSILYDGALDVCRKLRSLGKKIYIVTNGNIGVQKRRFEKSGLCDYVDGIFISESVGFAKPAKEYFDYVLEKTGAKREECLIIGDSLGSDILGGINSEIDTCWLNRKNNENTKDYAPTYTVNSLSDIFGIIGG